MAKLYLADTEQIDAGLAAALKPLLPETRQQRISSSPSEQLRRLNIAAGGLLLYAMRESGLPDDTVVARTENGKPYAPEYPGFCFSLSHSGLWAACAVGSEDLGADIQRIVSVKRQVQERCLAAAELVWLDGLPEAERDAAFCRLWSLKEAYLKATGSGLLDYPSLVQVVDEQGSISCCGYKFREYPIPGYAAAVCCRQEEIDQQALTVDLRCLIK